jgi:O-antigen ligase
MALAFCLAFGTLTGEGVEPGMQSLALGGAVLAGLALLLSLSRGAWLGAALATMVMVALWNWKRVALLLFLALVAATGMALVGGQALTIFSFALERSTGFLSYLTFGDVRGVVPTPETWALIERLAHWQVAWEMFADHPWLGVGIGNYAAAYPSYALPFWEDPLGHAHNYYLNILAETGLAGLAAYLALVVGTFWLAWRSWTVTRGFWRAVAVGALGLLVAFSVHSLFDNLYVQGMNIHLGIVLGMVEVVGRRGNGRR